MNPPDEKQWLRVEELATELKALQPKAIASRLSQLAAAGENRTVLTLLVTWLGLPPPTAPFDSGSVIGDRYTLREMLGEGGMGSVWRAEQKLVGRDVALKMIHPSLVTPALQERFVGEMEILGRLNHPGIVRIFDAGIDVQPNRPPLPFFAMELVEGQLLNEWAEAHNRDWPALLRTLAAICAAMQSAHERKIIHRDLKPSNILVRLDGQPVVVDFGIARLAGIALGDEIGSFSGTPNYAAPEQHLGRDQDFRSGESVDVYALGAIAFEILSGRRLFEFPREATLEEMRRAVLEDPLPRLAEAVTDCPTWLDELVARATRRNPADRFYSMATLGRAIARAAAQCSPAPVAPAPWQPAPGALVPGTSWRLTTKLGVGGMGQVWLGVHDQLGERRVFKFCDDEEKARTLKRELTLFRLLKDRVGRNPHFVQLHEVSLDEPPWYLMMEYIDACDLEAWCAKQPAGSPEAAQATRLEIVAQTAEALQSAHEAGILHRDVKPGNLLIESREGGGVQVLIADFGVGQIVADELLRSGTRLGFTSTVWDLKEDEFGFTFLYVAPEVLSGNPATTRSDIYSLGMILWQLLINDIHAALDPADWSSRIEDPLLREDLVRCLAGAPEKRWSTAGDLARSLRALPERRAAKARRDAELAARERAAYRRGALRTAGVAVAILLAMGSLAFIAWWQRRDAIRAQGAAALNQAATLPQWDSSAGRKERGMRYLEMAAGEVTNQEALRTAAARVLGMADLVRVASHRPPARQEAQPTIPALPREVCRITSHDGSILAVARDLDGLDGEIDLFDTATGQRRLPIQRKLFPWVPVAEPALLRFSPNDQLLAVGGAKTSRQLLLLNVAKGTLDSYIFQGSDPLSCAWHPGGRLLAIGCADGTVRLWDISTAVGHGVNLPAGNQFDLPPALTVPALDLPARTLRGHRGPVRFLAFSKNAQWLASLDDLGYLRIHTGFSDGGLPELPPSEAGGEGPRQTVGPVFALEIRLDDNRQVTGLEADGDQVMVLRGAAPAEEFRLAPGELPTELTPGAGLTHVAWNSRGTELCATTLSDIHWLHASPLEDFHISTGRNPVGVSWAEADGFWVVADEEQLAECRPARQAENWKEEEGPAFPLMAAAADQAARTALAATSDGRIAIYHGRRIQFFAQRRMAPPDSSMDADWAGGTFRQIFWDQTGRLLGVVFTLPSGSLGLETWATSTNFPPHCQRQKSATLECQRIVPANDGRHCLIRGDAHGLLLFDPLTGVQTPMDTSDFARQDWPLEATSDGTLLAMVADGTAIRLLTLPQGSFYAELQSPRAAALTELAWDASGDAFACATEDSFVQVWNLAPWQAWIAHHGLQK